MHLRAVLDELQIADAQDVLAPHWEESGASFPQDTPRFLQPDDVSRWREFALLEEEADGALLEAASEVRRRPALLHLAWHCSRLLYEEMDYDLSQAGRWPELTEALGELAGAFYLLLMLEAVPRMRAIHEQRRIPEEISRASCSHWPESVRVHQDSHDGRVGVHPRVLFWCRNHIRGDLFRLGRHEYMWKPFHGRLRAFRNRETGAVVALASDGTRFDAKGFVARADDRDTWRARYREKSSAVVGHPISPWGHALRAEVELPLNLWGPALKPGDMVLETHIPAGGGMTPEACRESMAWALEFFPRYFPEQPFVGFACGSWILNPELEAIYRPDSNMVLWQRELYLFPIPSGDRSGVYFVFGEDDPDLDAAPRDTGLRRALLDHMQAGGRLIGGGMFMLTEDFEHYGEQPYRSQWAEPNEPPV